MNKKLAVFLGTLAIAGSACATSTQSKLSPFADNLTIKFQGFPSENYHLSASYFNNNGINIEGPDSINPTGDALVVISSKNTLESGAPTLVLSYPAMSGDTLTCIMTFVDGPWVPKLDYKAGSAPSCRDILVSDITQTGHSAYTLTVTDNEA